MGHGDTSTIQEKTGGSEDSQSPLCGEFEVLANNNNSNNNRSIGHFISHYIYYGK